MPLDTIMRAQGLAYRRPGKYSTPGGGGLENGTTGSGEPPAEHSMSGPGVVDLETQSPLGVPESVDGAPKGQGHGQNQGQGDGQARGSERRPPPERATGYRRWRPASRLRGAARAGRAPPCGPGCWR